MQVFNDCGQSINDRHSFFNAVPLWFASIEVPRPVKNIGGVEHETKAIRFGNEFVYESQNSPVDFRVLVVAVYENASHGKNRRFEVGATFIKVN